MKINLLKNKKRLVLSIIASILAVLLVLLIIFPNAFFIRMPSSFICNVLELKVPLGTDEWEVRKYLRTNDAWSDGDSYEPEQTVLYEVINSGYSYHESIEVYSFHSIGDFDYESNPDEEYGSYRVFVELGETSRFGSVKAFFVFDEEHKLIDIVVYKLFAFY